MEPDSTVGRPFFYALEPRWFTRDRTYKVYVTARLLAGAWIAGQIYNERSAALQIQKFRPFLAPWVRRLLKNRADREALYDAMDPESPDFLARDARNFYIERRDICGAILSARRSMWNALDNAGVLDLELKDGSRRKLVILLDARGREGLRDFLEKTFPGLMA